ncbi:MAG: HIT family protein [Candidatus Limnocylindria bacterium]
MIDSPMWSPANIRELVQLVTAISQPWMIASCPIWHHRCVTNSPEISASQCLACSLATGALPLPGGTIHRTQSWTVEHCVGLLGVGSLVVKPLRHVLHVADLNAGESAEMGPLLRDVAEACSELTMADQVYVCLWSHAERRPGHIHFVVQPVTADVMDRYGAHGPALQVAMFSEGEAPDAEDVTAFAERARSWFSRQGANHS